MADDLGLGELQAHALATIGLAKRDLGDPSAVEDMERALEIAEGLAGFPQPTMLSDRRAAIEGIGLSFEQGLALEADLGRTSVSTGAAGAGRFAAGEGRGGQGSGV